MAPDAPATMTEPALLSEAARVRLFELMLRTRLLDERGMNLQRQGRIGFYVPATGQEGSHLGVGCALEETDWILPSYRNPGLFLLRGVPVSELMAQLMGRGPERTRGRQMPNHYSFKDRRLVSISSPIGTQIVQATGVALAAKLRGDPIVACTFFGDGATSSNDFHSGLNFAAVYRAPVIFVCENNGWAITMPVQQQTCTPRLADKAEGYGMAGVSVDGNDVEAVYAAALQAVARARGGGGPTLIETCTYRMGPHSTSDDPRRYRDEAQVEAWRARDPIDRYRAVLREAGLYDEEREGTLRETFKRELDQAVERAEALSDPSVDSMFEDVFAAPTAGLLKQRAALQDHLARHPPTSLHD